ncbi:uncharacterized protein LOC133920858 isoform X2 [Phragmites australis]|uniref:uncharacterized protein LOC133920858 isoform X2 n=1 Tax=Phragmites australis TaxID=29695 RepID=UPI002D76DD78|nr:uncharacterized protein LOC133920858 isoform X2 [Phragmites australis]
MMNVLSSHPQNVQLRSIQEMSIRGRSFKLPCPASAWNNNNSSTADLPCGTGAGGNRRHRPLFVAVRAVSGRGESSSGEDDDQEKQNKKDEGSSGSGLSREDLERLVGPDDAKFNGLDLANLIRKKYGRSYDVTLIKKEFMGRNLLAMNVMWKYREQRSFPLSEEEYLLRLDDVANTLKCWGAVAHVRNTLEKLKERPRIGKAVSIFIDMDETGGRSNEWIYK